MDLLLTKDTNLKIQKCVLAAALALICAIAQAQDPVLPQNNFGQANMLDGAPKPGPVWIQTTQIYTDNGTINAAGDVTDLKVSSLLSMQQFAWITEKKVLGGNFGFTFLQPIVKISSVNTAGGFAPSVNPQGVMGDLIFGPNIQWYEHKLLNKPFLHRLEVNAILPTGSFNEDYLINPSAHLYGISTHHAFTWFVGGAFAISLRNHLNMSSKIIDTEVKPGTYYHNNYSLEYGVTKKLRLQFAGYYVKQLTEDSFEGDDTFFQDTFGMSTTKEEVLAYGFGLSYPLAAGLFEAKYMIETGAINRSQGSRFTARFVMPLNFKK